MVVAKHIGRCANNMFQISAAIGYARKYGYEWSADYGMGMGEPYSSIHKVYPNLPKHELHGSRYHEHNNEFCRLHNSHKDICHFDYHPIPNLGPNVQLTGFFQSYKYFEGNDEEIKKVFALPKVDGYMDYVSIHVRRGDYVQHAGSFPPVDYVYISKGLYKIGFKKVICFSDDIEWCKVMALQFSQFEWIFSEGRSEAEDLALMASCGHHIIANSTFSWWGSYLGHNPDRIVISPSTETWFGPTSGVKRPVVDLLPDSWIKIHTR